MAQGPVNGDPARALQSAYCQVRRIHLYTGIQERGGNPAYKPSGDTIVYQKNVFN